MDNKSIKQVKQKYGIVGESEELNRALDIAIQVAPTELSVLIIGESGVGKEVIPRIIHDNSARKHNKYFAINCGSLPEGTIDSELFGHKKGSFTGAFEDHEGYFSVSNNGTLFLDEVGELPLSTQARLLRVLETGEYIRVGESEVRKTNVRIVAATNVNLQKAIKEGKFREDLYYRLNTIPISVPPLRDRGKDIELIFRKFAFDMADLYHIEPVRLTPDASALLQKHKWPGNIRQLRNLTQQISIICEDRIITAETLAKYGITDDTQEGGLVLQGNDNRHSYDHPSYEQERNIIFSLINQLTQEVKKLKSTVEKNDGGPQKILGNDGVITLIDAGENKEENVTFTDMENDIPTIEVTPYYAKPLSDQELVVRNTIEALERNNGNRKNAAADLGISERTLFRRIKKYGLENRGK